MELEEGSVLPNTIDEVIARLNHIIDEALRAESRIEHVIAKRDAETAVVGRTLYPLQGFANRVAQWIHTSECTDIRDNIQIISE